MSRAGRHETDFGEKSRALASFAATASLLGLAGLFFFAGDSLFRWVSAIPALFGILLFANGLHSLLASRTPPTKLDLGGSPLRPGQSAEVVIRQEGPVRFESLRASLVCERIERGAGKSRLVTYPCQENFFDSGSYEVPRMGFQEFRATVAVPKDAAPSLISARLIVSWRIEMWGKVRGGADFLRPFAVEVKK